MDWIFSYEWDDQAEAFGAVSLDVRDCFFNFLGGDDFTAGMIKALEEAGAKLTVEDSFSMREFPCEGWALGQRVGRETARILWNREKSWKTPCEPLGDIGYWAEG